MSDRIEFVQHVSGGNPSEAEELMKQLDPTMLLYNVMGDLKPVTLHRLSSKNNSYEYTASFKTKKEADQLLKVDGMTLYSYSTEFKLSCRSVNKTDVHIDLTKVS